MSQYIVEFDEVEEVSVVLDTSDDEVIVEAATGMRGPMGRSLEFTWDGSELGVRLEGETEYQYVDLAGPQGDKGDKGDVGDTGAAIEVNWNGTQLGVRQEGEQNYVYSDLKGDQGDQGIQGEKGDKGDKGDTGDSIEFNWNGTELGVRIEGQPSYTFVDLRGPQGEKGDIGDALKILGELGNTGNLPPSGNEHGDAYLVNGDVWVWSYNDIWENLGQLQGPAGPEGDDGRSIEFQWNGEQLGVRLEGDAEYVYSDSLRGPEGDQGLPGDDGADGLDGDPGVGLVYDWNGTELGVRREDEGSFQYADLQGPPGDDGPPGVVQANAPITYDAGTQTVGMDTATATRIAEALVGHGIDDVYVGAAEPSSPSEHSLWVKLNASEDNQLLLREGSEWTLLGGTSDFHVGDEPPEDTNKFWIDTSADVIPSTTLVELLSTSELNTSMLLRPDGNGGLEFVAATYVTQSQVDAQMANMMPLAGGTFTNDVDFDGNDLTEARLVGYKEQALETSTSNLSGDFDHGARLIRCTRSGSLTIASWGGVPSVNSEVKHLTLVFMPSVTSVSWPAGTRFDGGSAPELDGETWVLCVATNNEVTVGRSWKGVA